MTDRTELRRLAEAAKGVRPNGQGMRELVQFKMAVSPSVVLGLLDEIEAVKAERDDLRVEHDSLVSDLYNVEVKRDSLRADVARLEAALAEERSLLDDAIDAWASGDSYESHDVIRDRLANRTAVRACEALQTLSSEREKLSDEVERLKASQRSRARCAR